MRFPEFSGEWDSERLENLTVSIGDGLHSTPVYCEQGDYCFINGNNIIDGKVSINEKTLRVTKEEAYKYNAALLKVDTILMSINGTIGNVALYNGENIMLGKSACYINPSSRIVREYLFHILSSPRIQAYFQGEVTGTTIKNLSLRTIRGSKILLPSNEEQKKIARLFSLVDERIATQNKIIEDLKKLKSAISERLFNAIKGDVVVLEDIGDVVKGKQINGEFLSESGKYYVMNGGIEPSGFYNDYNVEANTISISEGGNSCGYVQFNACPFWSGGHCYTIQNTTDNVKTEYLYQFLKSKESEIMKLRIGSGLPNIQKKDLAKFKITIPNISEQKVISAFLSSFERKADVEMNFVNLLLEEKQYLLRQMFI